MTFGGTTAFANVHRPSIWTPGWCQAKFTDDSEKYSTAAKYESGVDSASLVFRCTIINGPHRRLRLAPNSVHDASNNLKISGTVTEYSWSYNLLADVRHGAVVKHATAMQGEAPTITGSPTLSESGTDGAWTAGETVEVTLTFSENIAVDTTDGTPSVGLNLGGTEDRSATYLRGNGTTALVFSYTLADADGSHTSLLVPPDSLTLNGGTIRSQSTGADAALGHLGAAKAALPPDNQGEPGTRGEEDPFTARFGALPQSHDGSDAFTFELHFSEAPEGLSYSTVAGGLLDVTGAAVTKARRLTAGSNLGWEVTMKPSQAGDIGIRLPARACTETNAVCAGGRALANAVSATVPGVPFTASFSGVPAEHDGATVFDMRFHLSEEPVASLSYRTVQNGLFDVTGGSIGKGEPSEPRAEQRLDAAHRPVRPWRRDGAGYRNDRVQHRPRGVHCGWKEACGRATGDDCRPAHVVGRRCGGRGGIGRHTRFRGDPEPGAHGDGNGRVRDGRRHRECGSGLHKYDRYAQLHRGRGIEDGLGPGARRRARRGLGDDDTQTLEPEPDARQARRRRGDRDHQQLRPDAKGVDHALRSDSRRAGG